MTVIGGGPAGYVAAIRAAQLGLKTAVVDKEHLGGMCLNWGCVPSKALLRNAEIAELLHRGKEFGFSFDNLKLDYAVAHQRSRRVSIARVKGVQYLMRKNKIDVYQGKATLKSSTQIEVASVADAPMVNGKPFDGVLQSKNIILATGAHASLIPNVEVDGETIITYREALDLTEVPKSIVIVGGGPIGCEFGYIFKAYGSEVTIIEMLPTMLPNEDAEVSAEVAKAFTKAGITLMAGTRVESIKKVDGGAEVKAGGKTLKADKVLIAIGFTANSDGLGLERVGVKLERKDVVADNVQRTNIPTIYAIGDVSNTKFKLAHVGSAQGILAAEAAAGKATRTLDYNAMPRCTYCIPQVASMGITEKEAKDKGLKINIGRFPFQPNGKASGMGEGYGFVKVIADAKYGEILGVHMVGPEVTELLPEWVLARNYELTAEEIARSVHAHPTLGEVMMEAAEAVEGQAIHI